jgi:hypothetical protein
MFIDNLVVRIVVILFVFMEQLFVLEHPMFLMQHDHLNVNQNSSFFFD